MAANRRLLPLGPLLICAGAAVALALSGAAPARDGSALRAASGTLAVAGEYFVPAGAHQTGAAGTNWRTDLEAHNCGATQASYTIYLLKRDQDNGAADSRSYSLGPGQSMRYGDIVWQIFGFSGSAALRIVVTSGSAIFNSRTYNALVDGTYGQFVRGQPAGEAIPYGTQGRIIQLTHNRAAGVGFRTNLGFVNAGGASIAVRAELYDSGGGYLGVVQRPLRAYEYQQVDRIFEQVTASDVTDGYAIITTTTAGGAFFAYASVVDNAKGDAIFIPAEVVSGPPPTPTTGGQPSYGPLVFSTQFNEQTGQPINPGTSFSYGVTKLYASWDFSGVAAGTAYRYDWYINGSPAVGADSTFPNSSGHVWQTIYYQNLTPLAAGTYQLVIKVSNVAVLQGQCTITGGSTPTPTTTPGGGAANLVPASPQGWQYPVVPNYRSGGHTVELLSSYMNTYVDWAVANLGTQATSGRVDFVLMLDNQSLHGWYTTSPIPASNGVAIEDYLITVDIPVGNHVLAIVADSGQAVAESNEADNTWGKTFEWTSIVFSPPSDLARRLRGGLRPPFTLEPLPASALRPPTTGWSVPPITLGTAPQSAGE